MSGDSATSPRLRSLDVFRGATVAAMILVNNPGEWGKTYWPLLHAPWHGCTPTDLIFPFFLFIVGVAIPFALAGRLERAGGALGPLHFQIAKRAAILLGLGLFLNAFRFEAIDWSTFRFTGVLQRIAVVYAVAALAFLHLERRGRVWLCAVLLAGYWLLLAWFPVPGFGRGDLSAAGNVAGYVDSLVLGEHVWRHAPGPADPEGLLSTLGALATALLGVLAGEWMRAPMPAPSRTRGLVLAGLTLGGLGLALALSLPLNKNLWTPTYVLFTGGVALLVLAGTFALVDVRGWSRGRWSWGIRPWEIFGKNAIFAFVGSSFVAKLGYLVDWQGADGKTVTLQRWAYEASFAQPLPDYLSSLAFALAYVLLWLGLTWLLDRKGIFLKV